MVVHHRRQCWKTKVGRHSEGGRHTGHMHTSHQPTNRNRPRVISATPNLAGNPDNCGTGHIAVGNVARNAHVVIAMASSRTHNMGAVGLSCTHEVLKHSQLGRTHPFLVGTTSRVTRAGSPLYCASLLSRHRGRGRSSCSCSSAPFGQRAKRAVPLRARVLHLPNGRAFLVPWLLPGFPPPLELALTVWAVFVAHGSSSTVCQPCWPRCDELQYNICNGVQAPVIL